MRPRLKLPSCSPGLLEGLAYFAMMSEWIGDASYAPAIWLIADGPNHIGSCRDSAVESGVRVFDDHHHPHGTTAEGFRD